MRYKPGINKLTFGIILVIFFSTVALYRHLFFITSPELSSVLSTEYRVSCLNFDTSPKPVYECYEFEVKAENHSIVFVRHESGLTHKTIAFKEKGISKIRFTPNLGGYWIINNGRRVLIDSPRPHYAKGFVEALDGKWSRSAEHKPFIPQYIMYDKADIQNGIQTFVKEHGFTGFHITNLRDFLKNPKYFETIIIETYRVGGVTHFWLWGDEQRKLTPNHFDGDVEFLYREIIARLGPIPGWTIGYGFDLFEWATPRELAGWHEYWYGLTSYKHLMGARGHKNKYTDVASLDYASWEWHRPVLGDYRNHIDRAKGKAVFSEDRFRIRNPSKYPEKDYSEELTLMGLWESFFSGGVANIWGKRDKKGIYSEEYTSVNQIRFYRDIVDRYYGSNTKVFTSKKGIPCLKNNKQILCFFRAANNIDFEFKAGNSLELYDLKADIPKVFAINKLPYKTNERSNWLLIVDRHNDESLFDSNKGFKYENYQNN